MSGSAFAVTHHAFSSGAGRTSEGNGSHASTLKSPSYTKSVSWQHYPQFLQYQVVLLGPQVKYMLQTLSDKAATHGIPVQPIDMMDYGMQRGDKVLDFALSLIEAAH